MPDDLKPQPNPYELRVARLCAKKFQSDVIFLPRGPQKTADIKVMKTSVEWEMKNIEGKSRRTIANNLREASKQSPNIIISLLKPGSMDPAAAKSRVQNYLRTNHSNIKHVIIVTKQGQLIDIC